MEEEEEEEKDIREFLERGRENLPARKFYGRARFTRSSGRR